LFAAAANGLHVEPKNFMAEKQDSGKEQEWSRLMAAAQEGDRAAYERLLREILPLLRAIAGRWHRRPDRVEDVVQDVLLTIHRVRHTYDPARPLSHWLATIAKRRAIDALRRRGRTEKFEISDEQAYVTFADPAANKAVATRDQAPALGAAISVLPESQREAVELLKLRELSLAEAAKLSGKSIGALKVNVHRAIKSLRAQLKGD
jgi:RNA polymerase sigma-70 factor (ECF subfamily)